MAGHRRIAKRAVSALSIGALIALAVIAAVHGGELAWLEDRAPPPDEQVAFYTCSMDPSVESDRKGTCPICGMALTPVTREDRASGIVRISASARHRIGLQVAPVEVRPLGKRVLASGEVEHTPGGRAAIAARVYRGDPSELRAGQPVVVSSAALPLTRLPGEIAQPDALRIIADNPDDALRPGMRVEIEIEVAGPPRLVVPAQAVIHAGARRIVFVDRGNGKFEPRTPTLGAQAMNAVEVLDGLAEGDAVVVEGVFLLAAESRIRSDGALWTEPSPAPPRKPARPEPEQRGSKP